LRDGEVVRGILKGARGGDGVVVDGDVAVGEVFGEIRTFGLAVRAGAGNVSGFEHGVECGVRVEVARAEGEGVGEEDGGGVSAHDVGGVVGSGPSGGASRTSRRR